MLRHPIFTCRNYDEYKDAMYEFNKLPVSVEKHNAMVELRREVERTKHMKSLTATVTKRQNSPDFVIGSFGFKAEDLVNYCNSKGYINFDILKSKESGQYVKVSDYGVEQTEEKPQQIMQFDDEEIPF